MVIDLTFAHFAKEIKDSWIIFQYIVLLFNKFGKKLLEGSIRLVDEHMTLLKIVSNIRKLVMSTLENCLCFLFGGLVSKG